MRGKLKGRGRILDALFLREARYNENIGANPNATRDGPTVLPHQGWGFVCCSKAVYGLVFVSLHLFLDDRSVFAYPVRLADHNTP